MLSLLLLLACAEGAPAFVARTLGGKERRGPLVSLSPDGAARLGKGGRYKVAAGGLLWLRQQGANLPEFPQEDHLLLVGGDCVPFTSLRLDGSRFKFHHPDLGREEASIDPSRVVAVWRAAPGRALRADVARRRFASATRAGDVVLLRNGDTISGTLGALDEKVVLEAGMAKREVSWKQVAAIGLTSALLAKDRPGKGRWRVVLAPCRTSPGGRFTVTAPQVEDDTFRAKTTFGAALSVGLERVVSLVPEGEHAVALSSLVPAKYDYFPYLDEKAKWSADATEAGGDLKVGGSIWARGVSLKAHSRSEYGVKGRGRFEALVGLDEREGKRGRAKCLFLLDGKLKEERELEWGKPPARVTLPLAGAKTLTIEVKHAGTGPVGAVVNVVDAWLVREAAE